MAKTLYDKIWDAHLVEQKPGETPVLYIDRHLVHEVTSPQAFEGLRNNRPQGAPPGTDPGGGRPQCADQGPRQRHHRSGIAASRSRPWKRTPRNSASNISRWTISARASCTSSARNRAGPCPAPPSSAATATPPPMARSARWPSASAPRKSSMCWRPRPCCAQTSKNMRVTVNGKLPEGVTAKDIALAVIAKIGTAGGTGYVIEYAGEAVRDLSMEGRMTLVQSHHRRRRPRRPGRGGRHHHQLHQGPPARAQGRGVRSGGALLAHPAVRSGCEVRCRSDAGCARHRADGDLGHLAGTGAADHRAMCPIPPR